MMMQPVKFPSTVLALIVALFVCTGCTSTKNIESVKAEGYNKIPRSILVFLPKGISLTTVAAVPNSNEAYVGEGFSEIFQKFASGCNIIAQTNLEAKKDGKIPPSDVLISVLNPDWVMTVEGTQAQTSQMTMNGVPMGPARVTGITYNVTITDHQEGNKIWRANVKVPLTHNWLTGGDEKQPGRNAATMVINQMRTDGLLTTCPGLQE